MQVSEVYRNYEIPPNLQDHMYRVAGVGAWIADHWIGKESLDKDRIISALLLHDTGNIIKFDFSRPQLLGNEQSRIDYWIKIQKKFKEKYKNSEHIAMEEIATEIGVDERTQYIISERGGSNGKNILDSNDWDLKVACYSDFRVDPYGVVTLNERYDDLLRRYAGRNHELSQADKIERERGWLLEIEKQLQPRVIDDLNTIASETIQPYIDSFTDYDITAR